MGKGGNVTSNDTAYDGADVSLALMARRVRIGGDNSSRRYEGCNGDYRGNGLSTRGYSMGDWGLARGKNSDKAKEGCRGKEKK